MTALGPPASRVPAMPGGSGLGIYLLVVLPVLLIQLDDYLARTAGIETGGFLVLPMLALPYLVALLLLPSSDALAAPVLEAWQRNGLVLTAFLGWVACHVISFGGFSLIGDLPDVTLLFPLYHFVLLLFGIAVAAPAGSEAPIRRAAQLALVLLGGSVVIDLFLPGTFSVRSYRPAGLTTDANVTAVTLLTILPFCIGFDRFRLQDLAWIGLTFALVMVTMSRSGLLIWLVVTAIYAACAGRSRPVLTLAVLAGGAVTALGLVVLIADMVGSLSIASMPEVQRRLDQLLLRSDVLADDYRPALLRHFLDLAWQAPLTGHGTGYALGMALADAPFGFGPHNMYLRLWVDLGLLGLIAYLAVLGTVLATALSRHSALLLAVAVVILIDGLFSHTLTESKCTLLALGMALGASSRRITPS